MTDGFAIRFRAPSPADAYELALAMTAAIYTVVELAEPERYFLRDQLDRRSAAVPILIAQGHATEVMHDRRTAFRRARQAARDCLAVLDIFGQRGTVEPAALGAARAATRAVIDKLGPLTVAPPRVY
ncbi:MAG TPA: four helix bundle protein [Kofleriaceae bacterium]|nr:four helix bundle protein [Kofleriaceae bacterium]